MERAVARCAGVCWRIHPAPRLAQARRAEPHGLSRADVHGSIFDAPMHLGALKRTQQRCELSSQHCYLMAGKDAPMRAHRFGLRASLWTPRIALNSTYQNEIAPFCSGRIVSDSAHQSEIAPVRFGCFISMCAHQSENASFWTQCTASDSTHQNEIALF